MGNRSEVPLQSATKPEIVRRILLTCHAANSRSRRVSGLSTICPVNPQRWQIEETKVEVPCCFQQVTQGHSHGTPCWCLMSVLVLHVLRKRVVVCSRP